MGIKTILDKNGEILVDNAWQKKDGSFSNCKCNESDVIVENLYAEIYKSTTNQREHYFLKPKWNGTQWIELASNEELQEAYPPLVTVPTLEQRTAALEAATMALMGGV